MAKGSVSEVVHDGVVYPSIASACKALGVPYPRTMQRLKTGHSFKDAVSTDEIMRNKITVFGVDYPNTSAALKKFSIHRSTLRVARKSRKFAGKTDTEIIEHYAKHTGARGMHVSVTVRGIEYESVETFCEATGVSDGYVRSVRRKQSISTEQACEFCLSESEARLARIAASKAKAADRKANALAKAEERKARAMKSIVQGEYTPLKICIACCKVYQPTSVNWGSWFKVKPFESSKGACSDVCRTKLKRTHSKKTRKVRRSEGKETKYRLVKRAKKVGARIDLGITAAKVAKRDGFKCQLCGDRVEKHLGKGWQPKGWSVGHIIPNAMGGHLTWDNVWCECCECNSLKGDRVLARWAFKKRAETDQLSFIEELDQSMAAWRTTTPAANRPEPCQSQLSLLPLLDSSLSDLTRQAHAGSHQGQASASAPAR